jgi:YVTN family beta-propeller protein
MKRYFSGLRYLSILLAMPLAASTFRIYVLSSGGGTIQVIDPATNKVVQTIDEISVPAGIVFSPDGSRAYVTDEAENSLVVLDTKTGKVIKRIPVSGHPNLPAITPDGKLVLVNIHEDPPVGAVDIVDTTSLTKVKTIPTRGRMHDIYISADGKYAVSGAAFQKFAVVIDIQKQEVAWEIPFDSPVATMSIENGPDGSPRRVFVETAKLNGFSVVNFATHKVVSKIQFPDSPSGFSSPNNLTHGSGIAPDGKTLWVNSRAANAVFVYSLPELELRGYVPMPELKVAGHSTITGDPHWLTITPDGKTVYISNSHVNLVSVVDAKTMKEVTRIPVAEAPRHIETLVIP